MSETEEYKKRSAGMNAMENAGAFAVTYWTAADVLSLKGKHPLTVEEAEEILERIQTRLHEHMVNAGWALVGEAFHDFIKERG
jgi:cell division GTPase FtsZ